MERRFNAYLRGERSTALFSIGWGALSAAAAAWAYLHWQGELFWALLFTVCLLSLVQLRAGIRRLVKARSLSKELHSIVEIAPPTFAALELPRLDKQEQSLMRRRFIEQALFVMGLCFALAGGFGISGQSLLGTGIGLCIQMAILLIITLTSQWRATLYRNEIERERGP
ncbi:MAG: hypothetical protein H6573_00570 [Lewinellaceae bacterium]|nr:hypothetical protein [Phaeodactylibacter sp.]MCB0614850.1 hypothetical protein [Phaeodactylibacter sp.]MCB9345991.1 hypothetical protein [Lewinellaceae bacterium]